MLADFATRLAGGLAALLLVAPWRAIPPRFFRTDCQIMLGLLVLAALDASRAGSGRSMVVALVAPAVLTYFATIGWGLGLRVIGFPFTAAVAALCGAALIVAARSRGEWLWLLNAAGALSSAFALGATLSAMLLGHHYLTAPAMSIEPLLRFLRCMAWALGARGVFAAVGLLYWLGRPGPSGPAPSMTPLFLAIRWGMGFLGPVVAARLAWKTAEIRSTQSATGILYIAMTLLLFGELSAMILSRQSGVIF